jgi:hypothetical protein
MKTTFLLLCFGTLSCLSASPAENVQSTSNPDAVLGCQFLGNVQATSEWEGGPAGTGLDSKDTEVALREKRQAYRLARLRVEETMKKKVEALGGNVLVNVRMSSARTMSGRGDAYRCPAQTASR